MSQQKNKRIVFIQPPLPLQARYGRLARFGSSEPPLGLCYLAAVARQEGYEASIIDAQASGLSQEAVIARIRQYAPRYAAITSTTMSMDQAQALAKGIKQTDPAITMIIGGCHFSALPEETMRECPDLDIGIKGEGEETLREILGSSGPAQELQEIEGAVIRQGNQLLSGKARPRIQDLDSLPMPAFDLLPSPGRYYWVPLQSLSGRRSFSLATSRGCAGACTFCDKQVFGNRVSMHSAEYVADMVELLRDRYDIESILFEDDSFFANAGRLERFAGLISSRGIRVNWAAMARVDQADKELFRSARQGRCWQVLYGVESGSQEMLDRYKKKITVAQIREAVGMAKGAGLSVKGLFIFGGPGETKETLSLTERLILGLPMDDISITFFTPYPGAEIWPRISEYGSLTATRDAMSCFEPVYLPKGSSRSQLLGARKNTVMRFYLRPRIVFSYIKRIRSLGQLRLFLSGLPAFFGFTFNREKQARLIISADDFGLSDEINQAVITCFKNGTVTSASLSANGASFKQAVALAKENPGLDIGLHLTLTGEKPLADPGSIPSLVDTQGFLRKDESAFFWRFARSADIEKELRRQFLSLKDCGLDISHVDGHKHLHILPGVLMTVIKLCKEYKVRFIRLPRGPVMLDRSCFKQMLLNFFSFFAGGLIRANGLSSAQRCLGIAESGSLSLESFERIAGSLKSGLNEMMTHPCQGSSGYGSKDCATLASRRARELVCAPGLERMNFSQAEDSGGVW